MSSQENNAQEKEEVAKQEGGSEAIETKQNEDQLNQDIKSNDSKNGDTKKNLQTVNNKKTSTKNQVKIANNQQTTPGTGSGYAKEPKYTPLNRYDFNMDIIDNWCEIRAKHAPRRRCKHSSFMYGDYFYIFGGIDINQGKLNDMFRINMKSNDPSWEKVQYEGEDEPEPLAYHQGLLIGTKFYVVCGENELQLPTNNILIFDLETNKWEMKTFNETDLLPLESHAVALYSKSENENSIIIFGGYCHGNYVSDLFEYSIESGACKKIEVNKDDPAPNGRISSAICVHNDNLYLIGGETKGGDYLGDVWKFSLTEKKWSQIEIKDDCPKGRSGHTLVQHNSKYYLFGGKTGNIHETNELWTFDPEKTKFELKHDTLLEQYSEKEVQAMTVNSHIEETKKSPKNTKASVKAKWKPGQKLQSIKGTDQMNNPQAKQKFDDDLLKSPNSKSMKNSLIFKMEQSDSYVIKSKVSTLLMKSNFAKEILIYSTIPIPRDGHSCTIHQNSLVVFGGDRNKFPLNDLFTFKLE